MSKLDDIFRTFERGGQQTVGGMNFTVNSNDISRAKRGLKDLILEIIGEDEPTFGPQNEVGHISLDDYMIAAVNMFREELRQKVKDL